MSTPRFDVRLDPDALKEYQKLDGSVIDIVNKAIDELEYRADEVGKTLGNKRDTKLHGCKEIKLRGPGIRIVFRVTNEIVEVLRVVYILTIERRSRDFVFKIASKRFKRLKKSEQLEKVLTESKQWDVQKGDRD
ncbi:hypothetical protein [Bacillus sp. FJAT-52991]|uniref:Addiction module toxin RelE n=1 Tax=Bacillus kandeliae TaxID=3129297 RepID=A0ABZ2NBP6_9BACI